MAPLQAWLNIASILLSFACLSYASFTDLKRREAPDLVWLVYGPAGLAMTAARIALDRSLLAFSLLSIALTVALAFGLLEAGVFGGADFKALACLALALPTYPVTPAIGSIHPLLPLSTLYNAYLLSASHLFYAAARNLRRCLKGERLFEGLEAEPKWRKALAFVSGYKEPLAAVEGSVHLYPMEEVEWRGGKAKRRLRAFLAAEADREGMVKGLKEAAAKGFIPREVWVTPGLPMLLFVALSLGMNLTIGDVLTWSTFALLSEILPAP